MIIKKIKTNRGARAIIECDYCGKRVERESYAKESSNKNNFCGHKCSSLFRNQGENHPFWNGGKFETDRGYVLLNKCLLSDEEQLFFSDMFENRDTYIREHRLEMARHLGRPLESWEIVHHKNGKKNDNRIENLELCPTASNHLSLDMLKRKNERLKKRVRELETKLRKCEGGDK